MVVSEGVYLLVFVIVGGCEGGGVDVVVLSEFEEGQSVFVSVYPSVNSAKCSGLCPSILTTVADGGEYWYFLPVRFFANVTG